MTPQGQPISRLAIRLQAERIAHAATKRSYLEQEVTRGEVARLAEAGRRASERVFRDEIETANRKTIHENARLAADVSRLALLLRNRPERPAASGGGLPANPPGAMGYTGAQLYRQDGEFLAGESAAAEGNLILLDECRARYDAAVKLTAPAVESKF